MGLFALAAVAGGMLVLGAGDAADDTRMMAAPAAQTATQDSQTPLASVAPDVATSRDEAGQSDDIVLSSLSGDTSATPVPEVDTPVLPTPPEIAVPSEPVPPLRVRTTLGDIAAEEDTACMRDLQRTASDLIISFDAYGVQGGDGEIEAVFDFAEDVAQCDDVTVIVAGHADATGDETRNLVLSWQRAENVIAALQEAGYDTARFEPIGFGSRRPIADGVTDDLQALNRRVDFSIQRNE